MPGGVLSQDVFPAEAKWEWNSQTKVQQGASGAQLAQQVLWGRDPGKTLPQGVSQPALCTLTWGRRGLGAAARSCVSCGLPSTAEVGSVQSTAPSIPQGFLSWGPHAACSAGKEAELLPSAAGPKGNPNSPVSLEFPKLARTTALLCSEVFSGCPLPNTGCKVLPPQVHHKGR